MVPIPGIYKSGMLQSFILLNPVILIPGVLPIAIRLRGDINVCFGKESIAQGFSPG